MHVTIPLLEELNPGYGLCLDADNLWTGSGSWIRQRTAKPCCVPVGALQIETIILLLITYLQLSSSTSVPEQKPQNLNASFLI